MELKAGTCTIRLDTDNNGWCHVMLITPEDEHQLGAEDENYLVHKLIGFLEGEWNTKEIGEINSVPVKWLLTFSEKHCGIRWSEYEDGIMLYFNNAEGETFSKLPLSRQTMDTWLQALRHMQNS